MGMTGWKGRLVALALAAAGVAQATDAQAQGNDDWSFGIGTGIFLLNVEGDVGWDTVLGPAAAELDLDNSEIRDATESAFGLNGFARKGRWQILYSVAHLAMEGSGDGVSPGPAATPVSAEASFEVDGVEVAGVYGFANSKKNHWGLLFGVRYTKHDYEFDMMFGAMMFPRDIDHDWTDGIIGLTHLGRLSERLAWTTRLDAGFGGSDGTYGLTTGLNWRVAKAFSLSFFGKFTAVDFENDAVGDPDWYLYDADEFGAGVGFLFHF